MRLVYVFRKTRGAVLGAFFVTLFMPTVILNGALWAQCDSIYGAFAVLGVYFALDKKPAAAMVAAALSFAFKLQAVFILPAFFIFLLSGRIKWYHLLIFPLTYFLAVLPAIIAGRPVLDTLTLYFSQTGSVGELLNYNSSSVFAFFRSGADISLFSKLGIVWTVLFLLLIYLWAYIKRGALTDRACLALCLLICIGVPYLLPHMHDRYFFIADVMSVALAFAVPLLCFVPAGVSFASLLGYYAYLVMRYFLPMRYGAAALAVCLVSCAVYFYLESSAHSPIKKKT